MKEKIAVIGAGISGLSAAYELQKLGYEVVVFEKEDNLGGRMATHYKDGLPFDIGANFLIERYENTHNYINELGLASKWLPMKNGKNYTFQTGQLSLLAFNDISSVFNFSSISFFSKLRALVFLLYIKFKTKKLNFFDLSETSEKLDKRDAYSYIKKRLGKDVADYLLDGFISTYNFHRSDEISISFILSFLGLMENEPEKFWRCHTEGEMNTLPNALAERLKVHRATPINEVRVEKNKIHCSSKETNDSFDAVVLSCTANITQEIYKNPTSFQLELLQNVKYSSTINVSYKIPQHLLKGIFCVTVPYIENKVIAEYTNEEGKEIGKEGETLINIGLHEKAAIPMLELSDEEIFSQVKQELIKVCPPLENNTSLLKNHDLKRWPKAMPKFYHPYIKQVRKFWNEGQGQQNVYFCGDYLNSPWIEGSISCGKKVAALLHKNLTQQEST